MRTSRIQNTKNVIHEPYADEWQATGWLTQSIKPREGFEQRWVRMEIRGERDGNNALRKAGEGWKPRPLDSIANADNMPTLEFKGQNVVGVHGMILMERPIELGQKYRARVQHYTQEQTSRIRPTTSNERGVVSSFTAERDVAADLIHNARKTIIDE